MKPLMVGSSATSAGQALMAEVARDVGPEREQCERELTEAGVPLPLPHRCAWARSCPTIGSWFLSVRDSRGICRGGFALEVNPSRALPGHLLLHAERFGPSLPGEAQAVALAALAALAHRNRRILRVSLQVFERSPELRATLEQVLAVAGFSPVHSPRRYTHTLAVDLASDEAGILSSFHSTARRHIRAIAKHPVSILPIDDCSYTGRMESLMRETLARTGGEYRARDFKSLIEFSRNAPELSRLVGLFRNDMSGPDALLAFARGCAHGDHVHYDLAASTRATDLKMPLAYALCWDLISWANRAGAAWFDFGGVTPGHLGDGDPLGGISDFKRYFSKRVIEVGGEWALEPHWLKSKIARAVSATAGWMARARTLWMS